MAPRQSQSSLPSSISTPQLGIVHQGRYLSVSGSPSYPPPSNNSSSGLPTFRSFRSLLPFGPGKNTPKGPPTTPARSSSNGRRNSVGGERSVSAPHPPALKHQEEPPVLSIEFSHPVNEPLFNTRELQDKLGVEPRTPESIPPSQVPSNGPLRATEQRTFYRLPLGYSLYS